MVEQGSPIVVFDDGSAYIKAGFSGEDAPRVAFPSVIGRQKYRNMEGIFVKSSYIGEEAIAKRSILNLTSPISAGIVECMEDMEKIWYHSYYNELRYDPSD